MNYFCPNRTRVGRSQQHTSTQTSLECPPAVQTVDMSVVKIAPGKVIEDSNGDKFFSIWYCSKANWNPVEWWGFFFYKKKLSAKLHFHNFMSCKGYMSKNCHENYGKSKLMQKCLKYMYKLGKKMHVFAHTPNMSCKVCILHWPKYQAS